MDHIPPQKYPDAAEEGSPLAQSRLAAARAGIRLALGPAGGETWIHLVEEGLVRPVAITPDGREFGLGLLGPGEAFLHRDGEAGHGLGFYVEAVQDCRCVGYPRAELGELARRDPQGACRLLLALTRQVADLSELAASLTLEGPADRLLRLLRRLAGRHGVADEGALRLRLRQQDLAAMAGLCRETVNASLAVLAQRGLLRLGRQTVWLLPGTAPGQAAAPGAMMMP